MRAIIAASFTFFLLANTASAEEEKRLSAVEIEALLSDRTALGEHRGKATRQYFDPTGWSEYLSQGAPPSRGKWRVDEASNQYCSQWGAFSGWSCYDVVKSGDQFFWVQGKEYRSPFIVTDGYKMAF